MMTDASVDLADDFLRSSPLPPDEQDLLTASFYSAPSSPTLSSQGPPFPNSSSKDASQYSGASSSHTSKDAPYSGASFGREASWSGEPGTEGLQVLAGLIDSILARIRVVIKDIHLQILVPMHSSTYREGKEEEKGKEGYTTPEGDHQDRHGRVDIHLSHLSYVDSSRSSNGEGKVPDPTESPKDVPGASFLGVPDELSKSILIGPIRITLGGPGDEVSSEEEKDILWSGKKGKGGDHTSMKTSSRSRSTSIESHHSATSLSSIRTVISAPTDPPSIDQSTPGSFHASQEEHQGSLDPEAPSSSSPILLLTTLGKGHWLKFRIRSRGAEPIDRSEGGGGGGKEGKRAWEGEGRMEELFFLLSPFHLRILSSLVQSMSEGKKVQMSDPSGRPRYPKYSSTAEEEEMGGWEKDFALSDPIHSQRHGRARDRWGGRRSVDRWDELVHENPNRGEHSMARGRGEEEEGEEGLDALVGQVAASVGAPPGSQHTALHPSPRVRDPLIPLNSESNRRPRGAHQGSSFHLPLDPRGSISSSSSRSTQEDRKGRLFARIGKIRLLLLIHDLSPQQAALLQEIGKGLDEEEEKEREEREGGMWRIFQEIGHITAHLSELHLEWQHPGSFSRLRGQEGMTQVKVSDFWMEEWVSQDPSLGLYHPILWRAREGDGSHGSRSVPLEGSRKDTQGFSLYEPWSPPRPAPANTLESPFLWTKYDLTKRIFQGTLIFFFLFPLIPLLCHMEREKSLGTT